MRLDDVAMGHDITGWLLDLWLDNVNCYSRYCGAGYQATVNHELLHVERLLQRMALVSVRKHVIFIVALARADAITIQTARCQNDR
jgi:hypothetical protein